MTTDDNVKPELVEKPEVPEENDQENDQENDNNRIQINTHTDYSFTVFLGRDRAGNDEWNTQIFHKGNPLLPILLHKKSWNVSLKSRDDAFIDKLEVIGLEKKEAKKVLNEFCNTYGVWVAQLKEKQDKEIEERSKKNEALRALRAITDKQVSVRLQRDDKEIKFVMEYDSENKQYIIWLEIDGVKPITQPINSIPELEGYAVKTLNISEEESKQLVEKIQELLKPHYEKIISLDTTLTPEVKAEMVYQNKVIEIKAVDKYAGITKDGKPTYFGCIIPYGYKISWKGIEKEEYNSYTEEYHWEHTCDIRVMVTGYLHSTENTCLDMVRVSWVEKGNQLREEFVPLSSVLGMKEFRENLRIKNLRVDDIELKGMIKFLNSCITANENKKDTEFLTGIIHEKTGWVDNTCTQFVHGNRMFTDNNGSLVTQPVHFSNTLVAQKLMPKGNIHEWIKAINPLLMHDRVWFVLCDALASVLLRVLQAPPHSVILVDASGRGKSTTIQIAASAIGNPDDIGSGLLNTGDISIPAANIYLKEMIDLPTFFDETTSSGEHFRKTFPYLIGNAQAPARATKEGKLRARDTYMSNAFVTAEESLISQYANDGANARALKIKQRLIPENSQAMVDTAKYGVRNNYGLIIEPYIEQVFRLRNHLKPAFDKVKERLLNSASIDDRIKRQAAYFACVEVSAVLVSQTFTQINNTSTEKLHVRSAVEIKDTIDRLWREFCIEGSEQPMAIRALASFNDFISSNMNKSGLFCDEITNDRDEQVHKNNICIWDNVTSVDCLYSPLSEFLKKAGYTNIDGVLSGWKEKGIIEVDYKEKGNTRQATHVTSVNPVVRKQVRVIRVITSKLNEYLEMQEAASEEDKREAEEAKRLVEEGKKIHADYQKLYTKESTESFEDWLE